MMTTDTRLITDSPLQSSSPQNTHMHIKATMMRLFHPAPQAFLCPVSKQQETYHVTSSVTHLNCDITAPAATAVVSDETVALLSVAHRHVRAGAGSVMWPNEIFMLVASRTSADALHQHWILNLISVYLMCGLSLFRVLSLEGTGLDCRWASCPVWRDQTQQRQPLRLCTYRSVLWLPFMPVQLCTLLWILFVCLVILWAEGWKKWDDVILWWHRAMFMGPVWDPRGPRDNPRGFGLLGLLENKLVRVGESAGMV